MCRLVEFLYKIVLSPSQQVYCFWLPPLFCSSQGGLSRVSVFVRSHHFDSQNPEPLSGNSPKVHQPFGIGWDRQTKHSWFRPVFHRCCPWFCPLHVWRRCANHRNSADNYLIFTRLRILWIRGSKSFLMFGSIWLFTDVTQRFRQSFRKGLLAMTETLFLANPLKPCVTSVIYCIHRQIYINVNGIAGL